MYGSRFRALEPTNEGLRCRGVLLVDETLGPNLRYPECGDVGVSRDGEVAAGVVVEHATLAEEFARLEELVNGAQHFDGTHVRAI